MPHTRHMQSHQASRCVDGSAPVAGCCAIQKRSRMNPILTLIFAVLLIPANLSAEPKLTLYDDGLSCPADCDSHVVFHLSMNGTRYAHKPMADGETYTKCVLDEICEICFDDAATECIPARYRGNGPGRDTFDLTPAFYNEWCVKDNLPESLLSSCNELRRAASKLVDRINCIKQPESPACAALMENAIEAKASDTVEYLACMESGENRYNEGRSDDLKRAHGCTYEYESKGGPNSKGMTWQRLLPGACRPGTFVGRDGLDCCSGETFLDGKLGLECRHFYPKP